MASYFQLTLDTTAPSNGSLSLPSYASSVNITATISATGASYMKLWGDICASAGGAAITEANASWVAYSTSASLILTAADATKTVYIKFKDDVGNESAAVSASVILDTSVPVITIVGPDVSTISKVAGYNVCAFSFSPDTDIVEYKVKVVPSADSLHTAGTQIGTTGGSTNMSGGSVSASSSVSCSIYGADLEAASSGDGAKIIKVFGKDAAGNWSV